MSCIENEDKVIHDAIQREFQRQNSNIELIASEDFVLQAVMETRGSVLTDRYAEGYPGRRYYGGCEYVDVTESIAAEGVKALFGAKHVNVQPHSDSQANMTVYLAALEMGDTALGMNLSHDGRLTHGATVNFSGKFYHFVEYGMDQENKLINYGEVRRLAIEHQPKLIVAGASAYSRTIDFKKSREVADEIGARLTVDVTHVAGLVAADLRPNPVECTDFVTTTTHKTLHGPRGGMISCKGEYKKDIDKIVFSGIQDNPLEHVAAAKVVAFGEALNDDFRDYRNQVIKNAQALAQTLIGEGFRVVSDGTDNRLVVVDIGGSINMTGKLTGETLDKVGTTCNKNTTLFDKEKPFVASGVRLGTPTATTRGFDESAFVEVTKIISLALNNYDNDTRLNGTKERAHAFTSEYPLYN